MESYPLTALAQGNTALVKDILLTGSMRRRLQDMGMIVGTKVACLQKSASGDPVAYFIRGAVIALRTKDSDSILVCAT